MCFGIVCAVQQCDTPPGQICVLQITRLFGDESNFFFPWGIEAVSVCFFIPVLDQKHCVLGGEYSLRYMCTKSKIGARTSCIASCTSVLKSSCCM